MRKVLKCVDVGVNKNLKNNLIVQSLSYVVRKKILNINSIVMIFV